MNRNWSAEWPGGTLSVLQGVCMICDLLLMDLISNAVRSRTSSWKLFCWSDAHIWYNQIYSTAACSLNFALTKPDIVSLVGSFTYQPVTSEAPIEFSLKIRVLMMSVLIACDF
jgi:hypothetical protein